MYSFGFSFLICPAGWPVGSDWLLQGVTPIQVQAHYFNQPPRRRGEQPDAAPAARCRACGAARVVDASLVLGRCSSVLLVLELALDHLGLGTTAGALNSLDVLIKGC